MGLLATCGGIGQQIPRYLSHAEMGPIYTPLPLESGLACGYFDQQSVAKATLRHFQTLPLRACVASFLVSWCPEPPYNSLITLLERVHGAVLILQAKGDGRSQVQPASQPHQVASR